MTELEIKEAIKDGRLSCKQYTPSTAFVLYSEDESKGPHHENKYVYEAGYWVHDNSLEGDLEDALGGEEGETTALNALGLVDGQTLPGRIVVLKPKAAPYLRVLYFEREDDMTLSDEELIYPDSCSDYLPSTHLTYKNYLAGPSGGGDWASPIRKAAYELDWVQEY